MKYFNNLKQRAIQLKLVVLASLIMLAFTGSVTAANLEEILPLTNKIIMLKFVDGTIDQHGLGELRSDDRVNLFAGGRINESLARTLSTYGITSTSDGNYSSAVNPIDIGYNVRIEQTWDEDRYGRPTEVRTTYVYLFLPNAMKDGNNYTVSTGSLASNRSSISITFNDRWSRSEAVHVNNLGYVPSAPLKYGYFYSWMGTKGGLDPSNGSQLNNSGGTTFEILRASDRSVRFTGSYTFRKSKTQAEFGDFGTPNNNFSGADVYECDFSNFTETGEFVLSVQGVGVSFPFNISSNIYEDPFFWIMKSIYQNRSGIALQTPFSQYNRPIPHKPGVNSFKVYYTTTRSVDLSSSDGGTADAAILDNGILGDINLWGWYQDAGDWDAYHRHSKVPAYLMWIYELAPSRLNSFSLNIPESSGTALPDVLDEARWLIRYYYRMRQELLSKGYGTGGVGGGRVFGDPYPVPGVDSENGKGSWQDTRKWVCTGEDVWSTYKYAALAANFARILNKHGHTDPEGINWQAEAEAAWNWAQNNTTSADEAPKFGTYYNLALERMYAAAALFRLTGNKSLYETTFISDMASAPLQGGRTGFLGGDYRNSSENDNIYFVMNNYYRAQIENGNADAGTFAEVKGIIERSADFVLNPAVFPNVTANRAMRWGGNWWQPMGIGQSTTPMVQDGVLAHQAFLTENTSKANLWKSYIYTTADYMLGTNPLNMTMITGLGERYPEQIFHMDMWYLTPGQAVKKGLIPYGPMKNINADLGGAGGYYGPYKYYYGLSKAIPYTDASTGLEVRPGHERFMPSRTGIQANEFTVDQNLAVSALSYGLLAFNAEPISAMITPPNPTTSLTLQAEDNTSSDATFASNHTGFTGTGFMDFGNFVEWNNVNPGSGKYNLKLRYANGSSANRQCNVIVNGQNIGSVPFAPTGAWNVWSEATINSVNLTGNVNTIRIQIASGFSGPNLDKLTLEPVSGSSATYRYLRATIESGSSIGVPELYWKDGSTTYPQSAITSNTASNSQGESVVGGAGHYNDHLAFNKNDACSGSGHLWLGNALPYTITLDLGSNAITPDEFIFSKCSFSNINAFKLEGSNDGNNFSLIKSYTGLSSSNFPGNVGTFNLSSAARETGVVTDNVTENISSVSIYPNPAASAMHVNLNGMETAQISVLDLTGKILKTFSVKNEHTFNMPGGVYLMKISYKDDFEVRKVIFK